MEEHPIQGLMKTAMESIKEMVDVNTVVGDAVEAADGTVIIPISRVSFGFAAGGSEWESDQQGKKGHGGGEDEEKQLPFGGGSGAGVSVQPAAFLVVGPNQIRLLPIDRNLFYERLLDVAPQVLEHIQNMIGQKNGPGKKRREQDDEQEKKAVETL